MNTISNLKDALLYQINGLYNAELQLQKSLLKSISLIDPSILKDELRRYVDRSQDKIIHLEDTLGHLLQKPVIERNEVLAQMINEAMAELHHTSGPRLRNVVLIGAIQKICHYKISAYGTARAIAEELNLNAVPEILGQIVEWEKEADRRLTWLAVEKINRKAKELPLLIENKNNGHEELVPA